MATRSSSMFDGHLFITTKIGFLFLLVAAAATPNLIHCNVIESNNLNTSAKIIPSGLGHNNGHNQTTTTTTTPIIINAFGPSFTSFFWLANPIDQDWPDANVTKMVNGGGGGETTTVMIMKQRNYKIRRHSSSSSLSSPPKATKQLARRDVKQLISTPSIVGVGHDGQSSLLVKNSISQIDRCSPKTFETCLSMMQDVMENSSLAFPIDAVHLDITCRKLKSGDYCAAKYIHSCADNRQRNLYQDIVQGSKNVIKLLCQQGEIQQLYLKYAPCLKDISTSPYKCLDVVLRFQTISRQMSTTNSSETEQKQQQRQPHQQQQQGKNDGHQNNDESLQRFCCSYQESVDCQLMNVRKYCGQDGLRFFEQYMTEMSSSLINEHCIGYTFSDRCRSYIQQQQQQQQRKPLVDRLLHTNKNGHHRGINEFVYFNNSTLLQDDDVGGSNLDQHQHQHHQQNWNWNHHHQNDDLITDNDEYPPNKHDHHNSHDASLDLDFSQHLLMIFLLLVAILLAIIPWFY